MSRKMTTKASVLRLLDKECKAAKDPKQAAQMEKYFKHLHPFYGIKSPALRSMIKKVQTKYKSQWTAESLLEIYDALLAQSRGEKKMLAGYLLGVPSNLKIIDQHPRVIEMLGTFIERHVNDWATCDCLSSQVVRKLIEANENNNPDATNEHSYATKVQAWSRSSNDWVQRASCVSFVCLARHGNHNDIILDIAKNVIQNPERFPQLGVGWVLRNLSQANEEVVVEFIKEHCGEFSREGLRYAVEKMEKPLRQELMNYNDDN